MMEKLTTSPGQTATGEGGSETKFIAKASVAVFTRISLENTSAGFAQTAFEVALTLIMSPLLTAE